MINAMFEYKKANNSDLMHEDSVKPTSLLLCRLATENTVLVFMFNQHSLQELLQAGPVTNKTEPVG